MLLNYEMLPNFAGPGQWRGGNGMHYKWMILADNIRIAMYGSGLRDETAPFGLEGGKGAPKSQKFPGQRSLRRKT
ncbi:MAG: hydantoinase B/oxoprolinase family protein [Thermincola sp.]|nr:hydantoinase B/oxoprolinase family protein [Thermincola sp.]